MSVLIGKVAGNPFLHVVSNDASKSMLAENVYTTTLLHSNMQNFICIDRVVMQAVAIPIGSGGYVMQVSIPASIVAKMCTNLYNITFKCDYTAGNIDFPNIVSNTPVTECLNTIGNAALKDGTSVHMIGDGPALMYTFADSFSSSGIEGQSWSPKQTLLFGSIVPYGSTYLSSIAANMFTILTGDFVNQNMRNAVVSSACSVIIHIFNIQNNEYIPLPQADSVRIGNEQVRIGNLDLFDTKIVYKTGNYGGLPVHAYDSDTGTHITSSGIILKYSLRLSPTQLQQVAAVQNSVTIPNTSLLGEQHNDTLVFSPNGAVFTRQYSGIRDVVNATYIVNTDTSFLYDTVVPSIINAASGVSVLEVINTDNFSTSTAEVYLSSAVIRKVGTYATVAITDPSINANGTVRIAYTSSIFTIPTYTSEEYNQTGTKEWLCQLPSRIWSYTIPIGTIHIVNGVEGLPKTVLAAVTVRNSVGEVVKTNIYSLPTEGSTTVYAAHTGSGILTSIVAAVTSYDEITISRKVEGSWGKCIFEPENKPVPVNLSNYAVSVLPIL